MKKPKRPSSRSLRSAPTRRGTDVRQRVVETATRLLQARSFYEVSLVDLARETGIARASLLLQYQQGWPDVLLDVATQQISPDPYYEDAEAKDSRSSTDRVMEVLSAVLSKAETTGLLYANLRAATFLWGPDLHALYRFTSQDFVGLIANLLAGSSNLDAPCRDIRLVNLAEVLYEVTLDLAARPTSDVREWAEHRAMLRSIVETSAVGVSHSMPAHVGS